MMIDASTAEVAIASERLSVAAAFTTSEFIFFAALLPKTKSQSLTAIDATRMMITSAL